MVDVRPGSCSERYPAPAASACTGRLDYGPSVEQSPGGPHPYRYRAVLPHHLVGELMQDRTKDGIAAAAVFNVGFVLAPSAGAYLILLFLGKNLEALASDGSLILASVAIASGTIPAALPIERDGYFSRWRVLVVGFALIFCFIESMLYGAVYFDIGSTPDQRKIQGLFFSCVSVASVALAAALSILLVSSKDRAPASEPGLLG